MQDCAVDLVPIGDVHPSTYNPRQADPERLDLVELSLRKLGWLLPIYATAEGEIVSGHQRHHVAGRMELSHVPVARLKAMPLDERKAVNVAFNRGTNDMEHNATSGELAEQLAGGDALAGAGKHADLDPSGAEFHPCLAPAKHKTARLAKVNAGRWNRYAKNMAKLLLGKGVSMPIITDPAGVVINGIGRLELAAERGDEYVPAVVVPAKRVALAAGLLNLLSMDFDLEARYGDVLRYNSFRRAFHVRPYLGLSYTIPVAGGKPAKDFDILNHKDRRRFAKLHGERILDFGAGRMAEAELLKRAGFDVTVFEPWVLAGNKIDIGRSRQVVGTFLEAVAAGKTWTSVFMNFVLNSVPFDSDREHIVCLLGALCGEGRVYSAAQGTGQRGWQHMRLPFVNPQDSQAVGFLIGKRTVLSDISKQPKAQRYFTPHELGVLFNQRFACVRAD